MNKTVLLVDDETGFHDLFRYMLVPLGYTVHMAHDGQEGLELFLKSNYDMVFLDVHMPKMSGIELLQKIKEIKPGQKVAILSSSSDVCLTKELQAKDLGAYVCLHKPFEVDEMIRILDIQCQTGDRLE